MNIFGREITLEQMLCAVLFIIFIAVCQIVVFLAVVQWEEMTAKTPVKGKHYELSSGN